MFDEHERRYTMPECDACRQTILYVDNKINNLCPACKAKAVEELKMVNLLIAEGHVRHCAYRQVWGDGECEC